MTAYTDDRHGAHGEAKESASKLELLRFTVNTTGAFCYNKWAQF